MSSSAGPEPMMGPQNPPQLMGALLPPQMAAPHKSGVLPPPPKQVRQPREDRDQSVGRVRDAYHDKRVRSRWKRERQWEDSRSDCYISMRSDFYPSIHGCALPLERSAALAILLMRTKRSSSLCVLQLYVLLRRRYKNFVLDYLQVSSDITADLAVLVGESHSQRT